MYFYKRSSGLFSLFFYAWNRTPSECSHISSPFTVKAQKMVWAWRIWYFCHTCQPCLRCRLLGPSGSAHVHVLASFKCRFLTGRMRSWSAKTQFFIFFSFLIKSVTLLWFGSPLSLFLVHLLPVPQGVCLFWRCVSSVLMWACSFDRSTSLHAILWLRKWYEFITYISF